MRKAISTRLAIIATAIVVAMVPVAGFAAAHEPDSIQVYTISVRKGEPAGRKSEPAVVRSEPAVAKSEPTVVRRREPMAVKQRFMPTSRRIDREINKSKYVYKGETMLGLTASYGTFTSEDADMFPIFDNINVDGAVATVNPFIGIFYRDNNCIGVRLGYTHLDGHLDNLGMDLDGLFDMDFSIPQVALASDRYSVGMFHRSYVALDERGRFGVFGEFEAMVTWGDNLFEYASGDSFRTTVSDIVNLKLMFSPGVAVYAFPNVCATLSFGLGGFKYNHIRQYDENGEKSGERNFSKLNFRLNLAEIRLGVNIHLWNKKKSLRTKVTL